MKLPSDVLYLARAALQLKCIAVFFVMDNCKTLFLEFLRQRLGYNSGFLLCRNPLQIQFTEYLRHLASHSSKCCLQQEGCADLASSNFSCSARTAWCLVYEHSWQSAADVHGRLVSTNTCTGMLWFLLSLLPHNNKGWSGIKTFCNLTIKQKREDKAGYKTTEII